MPSSAPSEIGENGLSVAIPAREEVGGPGPLETLSLGGVPGQRPLPLLLRDQPAFPRIPRIPRVSPLLWGLRILGSGGGPLRDRRPSPHTRGLAATNATLLSGDRNRGRTRPRSERGAKNPPPSKGLLPMWRSGMGGLARSQCRNRRGSGTRTHAEIRSLGHR
ncbi:hypothetical protein AAFF_G00020100 [Aldrovandia affinis]|uniref:Uncharacterized protein n=1 Tax=Aldrovandia affinis TaxID=143900 RepID=A0AAD7VXV7_9TELE|nr:hypothetical protein AAFF_G00020100 [Aldrovandia affinis]